jgi:hypothetical protein
VGKGAFQRRAHDFGEDIHHAFELDKWAEISIHEVDQSTDLLSVTVFSPREVHRAISIINKQLRQHRLGDYATVSASRVR